jgi:S-adenosylmethionine hydrolase
MVEKKPPAIKRPIITLTTDFGTSDYYVGAIKGVIAEINPNALVVDITHDVAPHDLAGAAFTIRAAFEYFPLNTIHMVVVDPGVGTKRRPILVRTENFYFVGPDNGVFSFVYDVERVSRVFEVNATHYFRQPVSSVFHARDIFAPCAAHLSRVMNADDFGEPIEDYARIQTPKPKVEGKQVKGMVVYADRFGNLVTNLGLMDLQRFMKQTGAKRFRVAVAGKQVGPHAPNYAQGQGDVFTVSGSHGFLEVASSQKSAAKLLGQGRGAEVVLQVE